MRPFRFGVSVRDALPAADWIALARKVERLGYATLHLPDHLTERLAPWPALAVAAAATTRLRVGPLVLNNDFRHPLLVAREAATLDVLSGGRVELGLGAGYVRAEYEEAGLGFDPGRVRVERLGEAVAVIKGLFGGRPVTFAGRHYRVAGHTLHPRPVQAPRPPLLVGGNGPRLLELAAREADIVGLTGITFARGGTVREMAGFGPAGVEARVQQIRAAAGPRIDALELSALVQQVVVTDDRGAAAAELARRWPALTVADILDSPFLLLGTLDEMAAQLRERRARWGLSAWVVFESAVDALAPVVARLAGR